MADAAPGFQRITAPDGSYVDFPEGTDDATISKVMAEAYAPPDLPKRPLTNTGLIAGGGSKPQHIVMGSINDPRVSDKQRQAYKEWSTTVEGYDPKAPPGSASHPLVNLKGATPPVGAYYFDYDTGSLQQAPGQESDAQGFVQGVTRPFVNAATWAKEGLAKITGPETADKIDRAGNSLLGLGSTEEVRAGLEDSAQEAASRGQTPGWKGNLAGGIAGTLPVLLATKNPWAVGGLSGALETKNPNDPTGVVTDAVVGTVTGGGSDIGLRAAGSVINPMVRPAVKRLLDRNVELTPGQIVGGLPHRAEDAFRSTYGLGDLVIGAHDRGLESFNRAAVQDSLTPLGATLPENIPTGHAAIDWAQKAFSDAYNQVIPQAGTVIDRQLSADIRAARLAARGLPPAQNKVFNTYLRDIIQPRVARGGGHLSGQDFKDIEEGLTKKIRGLRSGLTLPEHRELADTLEDVQVAFREMLARQNPAAAARIAAINDGYANMARVEEAAIQGKNGGIFTPNQLQTVTVSSRNSGRRQAARGGARMQQLAEDASGTMNQTVGDSGTAIRGATSLAAAYALFGAPHSLSSINVNPWAAGGLAALAAPYAGRRAGKIATSILTKRPPGAAAVRKGVERLNRTGVPALAAGVAPSGGQ